MGDQRRRGRGRSGRGGRIPRRGETPAPVSLHDETFISFPLDVDGPIQVATGLDTGAVEASLRETLERERRQATAVQDLAALTGDPVLSDLRAQVERHRDVLEQLARDLGADVPRGGEQAAESVPLAELVSLQRQSRMGWQLLQRVAYASGDKRIDRVVKPVLKEKDRHAEIMESFALQSASQGLFRDLE